MSPCCMFFTGAPAKRNIIRYDCCPEEYIDITFSIHIRRRYLYYVFNLVVPCLFLSCLSLLVFVMPPDSGEKVTCGRFVAPVDTCPSSSSTLCCSLLMHLLVAPCTLLARCSSLRCYAATLCLVVTKKTLAMPSCLLPYPCGVDCLCATVIVYTVLRYGHSIMLMLPNATFISKQFKRKLQNVRFDNVSFTE